MSTVCYLVLMTENVMFMQCIAWQHGITWSSMEWIQQHSTTACYVWG